MKLDWAALVDVNERLWSFPPNEALPFAIEIHGDLEVEVFKENAIGRKFYSRYGFSLVEEKLHEPTGQQILRLKFTAEI
jgi:hypothetical protein